MNSASFPHPDLRRRLTEIGVPSGRHEMRELLKLLPAAMPNRPYDDASADAVAEVLIYLAGKNVLTLSLVEEPGWGERGCRSYRTREELLGLALPFLGQGLQANERCIWVADEAMAAKAAPLLGEASSQVEVIDYAEPALWRREEERSLAQGYNGLRICVDAAHEAPMDAALAGRRIKALCTHAFDPQRGRP